MAERLAGEEESDGEVAGSVGRVMSSSVLLSLLGVFLSRVRRSSPLRRKKFGNDDSRMLRFMRRLRVLNASVLWTGERVLHTRDLSMAQASERQR